MLFQKETLNINIFCSVHNTDSCECCFSLFGSKFPHYNACVIEAKRTRFPKENLSDLIWHDRLALEMMDSRIPFVWILREHGTHIINFLYDFNIDYPKLISNSYGNDVNYYFWNGCYLTKLNSADEAIEFISKNRFDISMRLAAKCQQCNFVYLKDNGCPNCQTTMAHPIQTNLLVAHS